MQIRRQTLELLSDNEKKQQDIDTFVNLIMHDSVQKKLGLYLESLNKKTKK